VSAAAAGTTAAAAAGHAGMRQVPSGQGFGSVYQQHSVAENTFLLSGDVNQHDVTQSMMGLWEFQEISGCFRGVHYQQGRDVLPIL
jgi:hypothetical protein